MSDTKELSATNSLASSQDMATVSPTNKKQPSLNSGQMSPQSENTRSSENDKSQPPQITNTNEDKINRVAVDDYEAQKKLAIQLIEEAKHNKEYEPVLDIPLQHADKEADSTPAADVAKQAQVDYSRKEDLQKLLQNHTLPKDHTLLTETFLQFSCSGFFLNVLSEGGPYSLEQHLADRGEQNIKSTQWQSCDEVYDGQRITHTKTIDLEFVVKNNPFVKKSPTLRTFRIVERTE